MSRLGRVVFIGGGLLLVLLLAFSFFSPLIWGRSSGSYGWGIGSGMMGGWGFLMMGMMGVGMLIFWVPIIGGIIWLVQSLARSSGTSPIPAQGESHHDILKKRYSRGEIARAEYDQVRRDLEG